MWLLWDSALPLWVYLFIYYLFTYMFISDMFIYIYMYIYMYLLLIYLYICIFILISALSLLLVSFGRLPGPAYCLGGAVPPLRRSPDWGILQPPYQGVAQGPWPLVLLLGSLSFGFLYSVLSACCLGASLTG